MLSHAGPWISKIQSIHGGACTQGVRHDLARPSASQSPPFSDVTTHAGRWLGCDNLIQRNLCRRT